MGLLARARDWYETFIPPISTFERRDWLTDDDYWAGDMTPAGILISRDTAMSLSTVWRCVTLLSDAVSMCPVDVTVKVGNLAFPEYNPPTWLTEPNPADPTVTTRDHFSTLITSLLLSGNSFTAVLPDIYSPANLMILDPAAVDIKRGPGGTPYYEIRDSAGQIVQTLSVFQMLHIPFIRLPGQMRGINALEAMRRSIGLGIVAEEFGSRFFGQGSTLAFGVEVPGTLSDDQRKQLTESLKARYAGTKNSHAIGVLTAGAKFVPGLQPTPEQAQFLATRKFSVEDIARFFGVPPHLVGSQEPGASSYNSVEQRSKEFAQWSVEPLTVRIESTYQRLLQVPANITSPTATIKMKFNLDAIQRPDLQSRFAAYSSGIMAGVLKPNEARALEDYPPTQGGDQTYMQMQMVPTGSSRPPDALAANVAPARSDININLDAETLRMPDIAMPEIVIPPQPETHVTVDTSALAASVDALGARFAEMATIQQHQIEAMNTALAAMLVPVEKYVERDPVTRQIERIVEKRGASVRTLMEPMEAADG